jgi:hypothetical protein
LTSALDGGEWSASHPGRFIPRERAPGTYRTGGWVGPRAVLDEVVKRKIPSPTVHNIITIIIIIIINKLKETKTNLHETDKEL